jgi:hypothetical protein
MASRDGRSLENVGWKMSITTTAIERSELVNEIMQATMSTASGQCIKAAGW